jgi:hypothetical protein
MSSYEQIEGFEYWNKESWKKFVNDYVLPLHTTSSKLLKLREEIILRTQGKKTIKPRRRPTKIFARRY